MNRVENSPRTRVATPEEQSLLIKQAKQNGAELMKLQLNQALVQLVTASSNTHSSGSIGSTSSALTAGGTTTTLPNVGNMPYYIQSGNSCGTTTLAEIMSYLGVPMTQADVDAAIRRTNIFTSPNDMIEFARDNGLEAEGYNNGTWEEVKSMIDAGYPVQAMLTGDDSVPVNGGSESFSVDGLHYIAITGYGTDPATGEEYVVYHDPNRATEQRISVADFEKMWGDVPGGFDNYFLAYGRKGAALPPGRDDGIEGTLGALDGVTNITNGFDRIFSPDSFGSFVHGIPQFFGGIVQTIGSGIGGLIQMGAGWLHGAVEGIPVLENIVQPFTDIFNGVGAVIGNIFNGVGEALDSIGGAFESLFEGDFGGFVEGVGDAVGDVVGGVVDAVGDAVDAVGDAVSDFFSGW
ncbi:MAG: C39 family peptidase [Acidobacteria bacterium]|nr:C39 family peptidase [Acidobacteriota bacterium]MCI0720977.1 C39 family peptidase [Acidobacteriota bacterium]